ncbi:MAG: TIGR00341 family protein, partial [Chloroflexi bacterium]
MTTAAVKTNAVFAALPDFANTVLVPVANPDTAPALLEIALALANPDGGKVIALIVSLGAAEDAEKQIAVIDPIINSLIEQGYPVELLTVIATSISRGILDTAREIGADLLVLGLKEPSQGHVQLGTVVENVIETAPCDVMVYRAARDPRFERIVVPMDGSMPASIAVNMASLLAVSYDCNLSTLYIQRNYRLQPENEQAIRKALSRITDRSRISKSIITDFNPSNGVLKEVNERDLLVIGFRQKTDFERWLENDISKELLNRAPGPVILISRRTRQVTAVGRVREVLGRQFLRWMPTLTTIEQNELVWQSRKMATSNIDYVMLIVIAAVLATLGLLLNSAAVIIGAMLVAPLMQPLEAFSVGLLSGQPLLIRRSITTLFEGVVLALFIAILTGLLLPVDTPTSEMLARGNPSLVDAAVALASGIVAAYATARKDIPAALAGVAIAAALMPPVCTIGLGIAFRNPSLAGGAGLLFFTNIVFIIAASCGVYFWLGMRPRNFRTEDATISLRNLAIWWGLIAVAIIFTVSVLLSLGQRAADRQFIYDRLSETFAPAEVVSLEVRSYAPF